ncbi:MAG: hypothetical protein IJW71_02915 [Clostridia bacterium]|nr:hypothetical protein [Clostridia bacterium]
MKKVTRALKISIYCFLGLFCLLVLIRIVTESYYPKDMKRLYFTDELAAYYQENTEQFQAYTQKIRAPYDDSDEGNFFAKHVIVVPDGEHLQVCVRYNDSTLEELCAEYGDRILNQDGSLKLTYKLRVSYGEQETVTYDMSNDSFISERFMYHYTKVLFDGVPFTDAVWMRVDIYLLDGDVERPLGSIPVYESVVVVDEQPVPYKLKEYKLKKSERPA